MDGEVVAMSTIAARNIARQLGLPDEQVPVIEQAIKDEFEVMGNRFALAIAEVIPVQRE